MHDGTLCCLYTVTQCSRHSGTSCSTRSRTLRCWLTVTLSTLHMCDVVKRMLSRCAAGTQPHYAASSLSRCATGTTAHYAAGIMRHCATCSLARSAPGTLQRCAACSLPRSARGSLSRGAQAFCDATQHVCCSAGSPRPSACSFLHCHPLSHPPLSGLKPLPNCHKGGKNSPLHLACLWYPKTIAENGCFHVTSHERQTHGTSRDQNYLHCC